MVPFMVISLFVMRPESALRSVLLPHPLEPIMASS